MGSSGLADVTLDAGRHWHVVATPAHGRLLSIACTGASSCVAVGDNGTIVTTANGGVGWQRRKSRTSLELDGISCPTPTVCVAVGGLGAILRSQDGGIRWQSSGSFSAELTDVSCHQTLCAAVSLRTSLDGPAEAYVSSDMGASWVGQYVDQARNLFGVNCPSSSLCSAVGDQGAVDSTANQGLSWTTTAAGEWGAFHAMACPSVTRCLVGGDFGVLYSGAGGDWTEVGSGGVVGSHQVIESLVCPTASSCWSVGDQGTITHSRDGGRHWSTQLTSAASEYHRVLLVGDSVAQTLGTEIPLVAGAYGLDVTDEGILGCGIAAGEPVLAGGVTYDTVQAPCNGHLGVPQWPDYWQQYISQLDPSVAVLLAGYWEVTDRMYGGGWTDIMQPAYQAYIESQIELALRTLSAGGARVVLLTAPYYDTGPFPEDDPVRVNEYNSLLRQAAGHFPGIATVIDLNSFVDPGGVYTSTVDGVEVRQTDGEHFSIDGSALIAKWLLPQIEALAG